MQLHLGLFALWASAVIGKKEGGTSSKTSCEKGWRKHRNHCYKKFSERSYIVGDLDKFCEKHGAHAVSVLSDKERQFLVNMTTDGTPKITSEQLSIGLVKDRRGNWGWTDGNRFNTTNFWHKSEPSSGRPSEDLYKCAYLSADPVIDESQGSNPKRYLYNKEYGYFFVGNCMIPALLFVCKKKVEDKKPEVAKCKSEQATLIDGVCVCNEGYIDILDTGASDADDYERGEKCFKKGTDPKPTKEATSVIFAIDSSNSITAEQWPCLVDFVKGGADKLSNKFRVGFIKFASKITGSRWLEPGWSAREYKNAVPTEYDDAETNTPLALEKAIKMFENVQSKTKIVVLITDGLPVVPDTDREEEALVATKYAADQLERTGIRLTVMGVGPDIDRGVQHLKKWLKTPEKDYFSFADPIKCLKPQDFSKLMKLFSDF